MIDEDVCDCDEGWEQDDTGSIVSFDSRRRRNSDLIVDLVDLGFLHDGMTVLDLTYGKGRFWTKYRPPLLTTNDLDPSTDADHRIDYRRATTDQPLWLAHFGFVVVDPPYGLRGTINDTNGDYGLGEYMPVDARHSMMKVALANGANLVAPGGHLLYKCQEQACNGQKYPQPYMVYGWAVVELGLEYVNSLHVHSHRAQPAGRRQANVHQNYSTALLFRRPM